MKISRYTPIEDFFKGFWINPIDFSLAEEPMDIEVKENDSSYIIDVDLPGIQKEDINISVRARCVVISATRDEPKEFADAKLVRTEVRYGKLSRVFEMEHEVSDEGADAKFENGVLHLTLPKKNGMPARMLSIH